MARGSFSLRPAQAVVTLRNSRGIGIGEQVPRCGRTKQEPVYEVGGVFHTEGADGGIGERERDVRAAKSRDIRHVKPRAVRPIVREHEVEIRLADDAVAVKIRQHGGSRPRDRKSTRLNSSHTVISYAVFCLKKKKKKMSS